ncbi:MAG: hypothetical protein E5X05_01445 [Mesorhizobium sp.]|nr:MAG: hypothetical protein E5X05_01445 [Mesorhizobium sp.]
MAENPTLLQRINAVQREVDYVQKEKKQGMRYSIVSHDAVTAKTRPLLVKHGVVYYPISITSEQVGNRTQMHMVVRFVSVDDASDFMDVHSVGYGIDDQDKGPGKAESYAVKYALLKALGLETGDDPDQDQDVVHRPNISQPLTAAPMPEYSYQQPEHLKPNGKPAKGWRADGTRTSYWLKTNGSWEALKSMLDEDLVDCNSLVSLETLKNDYRQMAKDQRWNKQFLESLNHEFLAAERAIMNQMDAEELAEVPLGDALRKSLDNHPLVSG